MEVGRAVLTLMWFIYLLKKMSDKGNCKIYTNASF